MSRIDPLGIAMSGLAGVNRAIAVVSQNIANANTAGYVHESAVTREAGAAGIPMGITSGLATRDLDVALQGRLFGAQASASGADLRSQVLGAIDAAQGKPGSGTDIASLVGKLGDGFSTLLNDPASSAQQRAVLQDASALAAQVRSIAGQLQQSRQLVQDRAVDDVARLNAGLQRIGALSDQIMQARSSGVSTADLENQRDAAIGDIAPLVDLRVIQRPSGDVDLISPGGLSLPTRGNAPFSMASATVGPAAFYPGGGLPGVMLNGLDVTNAFAGGSIAAAIELRDRTLPTAQGGLDEFAQTMAARFDDQGLTLFSDAAGAVPQPAGAGPRQASYVGFSVVIDVNPAVNADPTLIRDGTHAVGGVPGGAQGFAPNPPGGPAGFAVLIQRVLSFSLSDKIAPGNAQPSPMLSGMGPNGTLTAGMAAPPALGSFATALVARQAAEAETAGNGATSAGDAAKTLQQSMNSRSGVDMDAELSRLIALQNAYQANARVITTMQSLWSQLQQMVQ